MDCWTYLQMRLICPWENTVPLALFFLFAIFLTGSPFHSKLLPPLASGRERWSGILAWAQSCEPIFHHKFSLMNQIIVSPNHFTESLRSVLGKQLRWQRKQPAQLLGHFSGWNKPCRPRVEGRPCPRPRKGQLWLPPD